MPSLDPVWLFLSLFPSGIGFVLFVYGKKMGRGALIVGGLAFMVYPFFTPTILSMAIVGVLVGAGTWWADAGS